jgi:hypothetical protein
VSALDEYDRSRSVARDVDGPRDVLEMAEFWRFCNLIALEDLQHVPQYLIVSHAELTAGGTPALARLTQALGLGTPVAGHPGTASARVGVAVPEPGVLHEFRRDPSGVNEGWREHLDPAHVLLMEQVAGDVFAALQDGRLPLPSPPKERQP